MFLKKVEEINKNMEMMVQKCIERTDKLEVLINKNEETSNDNFVSMDARQIVVENEQDEQEQKLMALDAKIEVLSSNTRANSTPNPQVKVINTNRDPNSDTTNWINPIKH